MRPSRCVTAARAASVCFSRSPKLWLGLLSTTTTATEGSASRSSLVSDGLASASAAKASATARTSAPRLLITISSSAATVATAIAAHSTSLGTSGEKVIPKPKGLPSFSCLSVVSARGQPGICSTRRSAGVYCDRPPARTDDSIRRTLYCPSRSSSAGICTWSAL